MCGLQRKHKEVQMNERDIAAIELFAAFRKDAYATLKKQPQELGEEV